MNENQSYATDDQLGGDAHSSEASHEMLFTAEHQKELESILRAEKRLEPERIELREGASIMRYTPEYPRNDEATGEPAIPLVLIRGMGDSRADEWYLEKLAEIEEREVIGVVYDGRLQGKSRGADIEDLEGSVSELEVKEAQDLADALEVLGVENVYLTAESRGAMAGILFMRDHPEVVSGYTLEHPTSLDQQGMVKTYVAAAREGVARAFRNGENQVPDEVASIPRDEGLLIRARNAHTEQQSVGRGRLEREFAKLDPNIPGIVTGDKNDRAILSGNLQKTVRTAQEAGASVTFEETDWGGHGIRYSDRALKEISGRLRKLERGRATTT